MGARAVRSSTLVLGLAVVVGLLALAGPVIAADSTVAFQAPSASSSFPGATVWKQTFRSPSAPARVELMTRLEGTETWVVQEVPFSAAGSGEYDVEYLDATFQLPNSRVAYRFRVTPKDGAPETGPEATLLVTDDRLEWRTLEGKLVRIHWASGGKAFAERALRIAEDSIAATSRLLGVKETKPIDFFVYADPDQFQSALGPGTKEFVAGRAVPEIRTLFGRILPDEIGSDWVPLVIGHELAHLVFDTATHNPYHEPPHWMNEGLATYLTDGYSDEWRQRVSNAVERGTLLPLATITDGFPSAREDLFYLGYGEGASAIDFFVRTYGQEKLVQLIRSYAAGVTDNEAFQAATGEGFKAFEAAWMADLGAAAPDAHGPQDAKPGPTPLAWGGGTRPIPTDAGVPSSVLPGEPVPNSTGTPTAAIAAGLLGAAALVLIVVVIVRRRRTRSVTMPLEAPPPPSVVNDAPPPSWDAAIATPSPSTVSMTEPPRWEAPVAPPPAPVAPVAPATPPAPAASMQDGSAPLDSPGLPTTEPHPATGRDEP